MRKAAQKQTLNVKLESINHLRKTLTGPHLPFIMIMSKVIRLR